MSYGYERQRRKRTMGVWKIRLLIAGGIVAFSMLTYLSNTDVNPVTGEKQRVGGMTTEQEVAIGLQAAPQMVQQHGGLYYSNDDQQTLDQVGLRLLNALNRQLAMNGRSVPYSFEFYLLADRQTVNAFALPGGQIFITYALYSQFIKDGRLNVDLLAGVIGHEIGHVLERHGAERMAKGRMFQGIVGAAGVFGGDMSSAQIASVLTNFINMKYSRDAELESDRWGVLLSLEAGFDPEAMLEVMNILEQASTGRGGKPPEFASTHPSSETRKRQIRELIAKIKARGSIANDRSRATGR